MPDILLVEGRSCGSRSWASSLVEKGYKVKKRFTRREAWSRLKRSAPGLMILDGRFLRFDFYRFCRALRAEGVDVPLLLILGEGEQAERGTGVNITLREPFTSVKLMNRVRRLLPEQSDDVLTVGEIILDLEKRTVSRGKSNHRLTPKQAALLEIFMRNPGKVLSRAFLMKQVWDTDFVGDTRTLEVHIHWLRRAVEENPSRPIYLSTVRRQGYCFDVPRTDSSSRS